MSGSDNSSYVEYMNAKNIKFSSNGMSRCDDCEMFVPFHSMAEHMASKHTVKQSESDQHEESTVYSLKNHYEKIDAIVRQPFRDLLPNSRNSVHRSKEVRVHRNGSVGKGSEKVDEDHNGSIDKANGTDIYSTDFSDVPTKESKVKHSRKKLDVSNVQSVELSEAAEAIKRLPREARPSARLANAMAFKKLSSDGMVSKKTSVDTTATRKSSADTMIPKKTSMHRSSSQMRPSDMPALIKPPRRGMSVEPNRPKIPTVFEMFNIRRSEMQGSNAEYDNDDEHPPRRQPSVKENVPKNSVQCPLCSNMMHKNDFKGHLLRKHYTGHGTLNIEGDEHSKCDICGNLMPQEHIQAHVERTHGNAGGAEKNKDHFIRCNYCAAYMHIDYMPGHLFRKHKSHEGSIGIIWPQYTDEQVIQWFNDGMIFIKNGAIFVAREEPDQ
ncbi:uncharacterized protein LOC129570673 [Sitodiplosis mosellana]|uniref:uncharacterized protein LOC129570673 n=1 Tax=Sitodiplosis mosellana TaxID=263140 RepID=UPI0024443CAA|nr:uncharacterized protein LOC129570673 [Sitodiplosis mosellana]